MVDELLDPQVRQAKDWRRPMVTQADIKAISHLLPVAKRNRDPGKD